ncbi:MAG TPA: hypothetical protein VLB67_07050 [Acidimicrobiia bacterium]|nr:hypothetical protein [Acidimicrobiia bacterium]
MTIETATALPAWVFNLTAALVAGASTFLLADSRGQWIVSIALIAPMAARPSGALPALFAGWTGLQVAVAGPGVGPGTVAGVIVAIHLLAVLTTLTANLRPTTKVELGVLAGPLRRLLLIQGLVQPAVWVASEAAQRDQAMPWLGVVAVLGLAALSWAIAFRWRSDQR